MKDPCGTAVSWLLLNSIEGFKLCDKHSVCGYTCRWCSCIWVPQMTNKRRPQWCALHACGQPPLILHSLNALIVPKCTWFGTLEAFCREDQAQLM